MRESFCKRQLGDRKTRERFNMKEHIHSNDFEQLAKKGWEDLSARLDRELPVQKIPAKGLPYGKIAAVLALLCGVLLLSLLISKQKAKRAPFQPVPKIVNNISFNVQSPDIVINLPEPAAPLILAEKHLIIASPSLPLSSSSSSSSSSSVSVDILADKKQDLPQTVDLHDNIFDKYIKKIPIIWSAVALNKVEDVANNQAAIKLQKLASLDRHARLGVNLNSATHGMFQSVSVGGGISVSFPIGKRFSVEPGVGYDKMRFSEIDVPAQDPEFSLARAIQATPSLNVKYRVRNSIEMPVSVHYQPIRQLALTGGVDVGLLISQQMVFEQNGYSGFDAYKKQLNEGELNQLNRVNIGAHGGVSWFPTSDWKLGVYYGQNLTPEKKMKQQKLKFSNHIFKVRMARYF